MVWRLSLLSFQVTTNYNLSRQDKWCRSLSPIGFTSVLCHMISSWDTLLTRTEWVYILLCTQSHSNVKRIPSNYTETIYSRVFLPTLLAESQQQGGKTHLPVKRYVIDQSHAKFSPQHLFKALKHWGNKIGLFLRNLQLKQTKGLFSLIVVILYSLAQEVRSRFPSICWWLSLMKLLTIKSKTV